MKEIKKLLPILVVCFLVLSGLGAVANTNVQSETYNIEVSSLVIEQSSTEYIEVSLEDSSTYLMIHGKPILPKIVKNVEIPFGAQNVEVDVTQNNVQEYETTQPIRPAFLPIRVAVGHENAEMTYVEEAIPYQGSDIYPSSCYNYHVGCGLNANNERVTHVAIQIYPVRYSAAFNKLYVAESVDIEVTYEEPENPVVFGDEYDLVIIAPSKFCNDLQKLVNHKTDLGFRTKLQKTGDIYPNYPGVDKPEKIKYFIKDAIETWGVKYVLLVGGLKSLIWGRPRDDLNQGSEDWYVPV